MKTKNDFPFSHVIKDRRTFYRQISIWYYNEEYYTKINKFILQHGLNSLGGKINKAAKPHPWYVIKMNIRKSVLHYKYCEMRKKVENLSTYRKRNGLRYHSISNIKILIVIIDDINNGILEMPENAKRVSDVFFFHIETILERLHANKSIYRR